MQQTTERNTRKQELREAHAAARAAYVAAYHAVIANPDDSYLVAQCAERQQEWDAAAIAYHNA